MVGCVCCAKSCFAVDHACEVYAWNLVQAQCLVCSPHEGGSTSPNGTCGPIFHAAPSTTVSSTPIACDMLSTNSAVCCAMPRFHPTTCYCTVQIGSHMHRQLKARSFQSSVPHLDACNHIFDVAQLCVNACCDIVEARLKCADLFLHQLPATQTQQDPVSRRGTSATPQVAPHSLA